MATYSAQGQMAERWGTPRAAAAIGSGSLAQTMNNRKNSARGHPKTTESPTAARLGRSDIQKQVLKRLDKYKKLNMLEQFAMFMGMVQILEAGLKNLLVRRYKYAPEKMERWTLGRTAKELRVSGLRNDFVVLLESVVTYRNHIAHEFLANEAMLKTLVGGETGRLELRQLQKGIYELEQILFLHDWCEEHNAWGWLVM